MDFSFEDSAEQGAFRKEMRDWLSRNVPEGLEHSVDPCDMSYEQYQVRRELGRRLGAREFAAMRHTLVRLVRDLAGPTLPPLRPLW